MDDRPLFAAAKAAASGKSLTDFQADYEALYIVGTRMRNVLANGKTAEWYREVAPLLGSKHYLRIADCLDAWDMLVGGEHESPCIERPTAEEQERYEWDMEERCMDIGDK